MKEIAWNRRGTKNRINSKERKKINVEMEEKVKKKENAEIKWKNKMKEREEWRNNRSNCKSLKNCV